MIQDQETLAPVVCARLDAILRRWALYRRMLPPVPGEPPRKNYRYNLYARPEGCPLSPVASWEIHQLPGCALIGVSCKVEVRPEWRGKGLGHVTLQLRQGLARDLGYRYLLATVSSNNIAEQKCLEAQGWVMWESIYNRKTTHWVWLRGKTL